VRGVLGIDQDADVLGRQAVPSLGGRAAGRAASSTSTSPATACCSSHSRA
jgi:hypothetical protein